MINITGARGCGKPDLDGVECPRCGIADLILWGWDKTREFRFAPDRFAPPAEVRRRRVRCKGCGATHVVQAEGLVARHKDAARILLAAFAARAAGNGFRGAADLVDRAASTVRNWFRAAARNVPWTAPLVFAAA
jgi:hypothetical protein